MFDHIAHAYFVPISQLRRRWNTEIIEQLFAFADSPCGYDNWHGHSPGSDLKCYQNPRPWRARRYDRPRPMPLYQSIGKGMWIPRPAQGQPLWFSQTTAHVLQACPTRAAPRCAYCLPNFAFLRLTQHLSLCTQHCFPPCHPRTPTRPACSPGMPTPRPGQALSPPPQSLNPLIPESLPSQSLTVSSCRRFTGLRTREPGASGRRRMPGVCPPSSSRIGRRRKHSPCIFPLGTNSS